MNYLQNILNIIFASLLFLLPPISEALAQESSDNHKAQCSNVDTIEQGKLLYSYIQKNGPNKDNFIVVGKGNHAYLFDQNFLPVSPEELATQIKESVEFKAARRVVLAWPYSNWNDTNYTKKLQKLLDKETVGFSGPLWWYPDGTAISSHAENSNIYGPIKSNIAECISKGGEYLVGSKCTDLFEANERTQPIFSNIAFVKNCAEIKKLEKLAKEMNSNANMQLYFYHFFVNVDGKKSSEYLSNAAFAGDPLANYLVAHIYLDTTSPDMFIYKQLLTRAADGGNEKAKKELARLPK